MSATPLGQKLRELIHLNGPMTVAEYMAHCLGDPTHGYYMTRDPFGARGDFVTAPEVSQIFGEIVGAWLLHAWELAGSPVPLRLVELGPGRGTLMADILRVATSLVGARTSIGVHLVETSPALRGLQRTTLAAYDPAWHDTLAEVPSGPMFLVANEFLDALPIRQFVRHEGVWRERVVGLEGDRLAFGIGPGRLDDGPDAPEGSIWEIRPSAEALAGNIARRIVEDGGAALLVDYGHAESATGDTLQAVRAHRSVDPLDAPGEADLTAHVDFGALSLRACAEGAAVHGPMQQGEFLLALGLLQRAGALGAAADDEMRRTLSDAVERLAGPDQMGSLFKVLALTRPGLSPPPFTGPI